MNIHVILISAVVIFFAISASVYVSYKMGIAHTVICNNHKTLYEQLKQQFPNRHGLNGQLVPEIEYLNTNCADLGFGNIRVYMEK